MGINSAFKGLNCKFYGRGFVVHIKDATFEAYFEYGVENWTLRKVDQKYPESFEMWCCRRMEAILTIV
jgi:hypothetical protein